MRGRNVIAASRPLLFRRENAWNLTDQIAASGSNILANILIARFAGPRSLGLFAIVFAVYVLAMGMQRVLCGEPLLVASNLAYEDESRMFCRSVLILAVPAVAAAAVLAMFNPAYSLAAILVAAATLEDLLRYIAFRRKEARFAAEMDLLWIISLALMAPVLLLSRGSSIGMCLWAFGGGLAAIYGFFRLRLGWEWRGLDWKSRFWPYAKFLVVDSIGNHVTGQATIAIVSTVFGVVGAGQFRAAQLLLSPGVIVLNGATMALAPRSAASVDPDRHKAAFRWVAAIGILVGIGIATVGRWALPMALGPAYGAARALLLPTGALMAILALSNGAAIRLRARRQGGSLAKARTAAVLVGVPLLLVGAQYILAAVCWMLVVQAMVYLAVLEWSAYRSPDTSVM